MQTKSNKVSTYQDTPVDIRLRLSGLWIVLMFIFAYVDIFGLFRAEVLEGLLDGKIAGTPIEVNQLFLVVAVIYILPASLMVYFNLTLRPAISRRANVIVAAIYMVTVVLSCIGEESFHYLLGSAIELVIFAIIIRTARNWPTEIAG